VRSATDLSRSYEVKEGNLFYYVPYKSTKNLDKNGGKHGKVDSVMQYTVYMINTLR